MLDKECRKYLYNFICTLRKSSLGVLLRRSSRHSRPLNKLFWAPRAFDVIQSFKNVESWAECSWRLYISCGCCRSDLYNDITCRCAMPTSTQHCQDIRKVRVKILFPPLSKARHCSDFHETRACSIAIINNCYLELIHWISILNC